MTLVDNNLRLIEIIRDQINNSPQQQITFAEYMELVLYQPRHGYYASNAARIGQSGDFLTSPHLASDFGEMLAIQLHQLWEILGSPQVFNLIEMGAGQGLLATQILAYSQREYPDFFKAIDYIIIEIAPAMIAMQQARLKSLPVRWCEWSEIADDSIIGCFLSNELIDALPVHQVVVVEDRLQEVYVTLGDNDDDIFAETIDYLSTDKLEVYWQLNNINLLNGKYDEGYRTEVNLAALDWLKTVSEKLNVDIFYRSIMAIVPIVIIIPSAIGVRCNVTINMPIIMTHILILVIKI